MYLEFFKLKEFPFSTECDDKYFFESAAHAEAMANMVYCIQQRKGMVLITGEVGSGKTLLARMVARRLDKAIRVAMVGHPCHSAHELLRATADGFDVPIKRDDDIRDLVVKIEQRLFHLNRRNRTAMLILDEVQSMPDEALEEVRMLWNFDDNGRRLIQFVLIGQPELRERILEEQWESLQQRVALAYHLGVLSVKDTVQYVLHRRQVAARRGCVLRFTARALEAVHRATGGVPRRINVLCDNVLLVAYVAGQTKVTSLMVDKALREMTCWDVTSMAPVNDDDGPARRLSPRRNLRVRREAAGE